MNDDYQYPTIPFEEKINQWISVEDSLPEDGQMIAACSDRMQMGCICRYCENENEKLPCLIYGPLSALGLSWNKITHWIPLPKPHLREENAKN